MHIDVYCTGSDAETSNSSNTSSNIVDNIANLMNQATVVDANDILLRHRKVTSKNELPRKLMKGKSVFLKYFCEIISLLYCFRATGV